LNQTNFDLTLPKERKTQAKLAVKDEYIFDFAELSPEYTEHELEIQLINHIREFLTEMGGDFAFIGNQYHLTVLDELIKLPEENPSIGIIICKSKDKTYVEYALKRTDVPIGIATYQLSPSLPEAMKDFLPEPEEIIRRLKILE